MSRTVLLTTGGTIASLPRAGAGVVAAVAGSELAAVADDGAAVEVVELLRTGSYAMSLEQVLHVARVAANQAARPGVGGVVVTHGTDTLEETAFLCDLLYGGAAPIVFTGAQRHAGHPMADGPGNLRDAYAVARHPDARDRGVLVCLGGRADRARAAVKRSTVAPAPFAPPGAPAEATVRDGRVRFAMAAAESGPRHRTPVLDPAALDPDVLVVTLGVGDDARLLTAAGALGARAVIVEALGLGNANPAVVAAVGALVAAGVLVGVTSRCADGPVQPVYGAGGGHDIAAAGALFLDGLATSHARVLLMAALGDGLDPPAVRGLVADFALTHASGTRPPPAPRPAAGSAR
ncbi:putative L-asparaginase [Baekduia alba]|uniref:asparaginase domain-containing protein n=1 Tax=Baekduia alba TaxID=2997333 RepID=UPI0023409FB9|nr:asparaginase domain-containing protein [Baekduia alba]WCB96725.1 putative L-asparaginase [Baekduia alba]